MQQRAALRFVPRAAPRAVCWAPPAPAAVPAARLEHLCALAHLSFPPPARALLQRDVSALLSFARSLGAAAAPGAPQPPPALASLRAHLDALSEDALDAEAERRWARLRRDCVTSPAGEGSGAWRGRFLRVPRMVAA